jgi:hypothetical protein
MKAIVVYESFWGNTAAIARAIAEGIGEGTPALSTTEATGAALAGVDLIVAGAPLMGFSLPSENVRKSTGADRKHAQRPPDLSHPSMRSWLAALPPGQGRAAAFETGFRWSPGSATKHILRGLEGVGYRPVGKGQRFVVTGTYGPLRADEIERARQWGAELAQTMGPAE